MKNKSFEDELNIDPQDVELDSVECKDFDDDSAIDDFKLVRQKIFASIVRSSEVLDEAVRAVKSCPMPKQIEAASTVIKSLSENAEKLLDIHEKIQKIEAINKTKADPSEEKAKETFKGNLRDITAELRKKANNE